MTTLSRLLLLATVGLMACAGAASAAPAVVLTWVDNSDNEKGFTLERAPAPGAFAPIANLPANSTTYTDTAVEPATTYRYRVCAWNDYGASTWSNEATGTTKAAGLPPTAPAGSEAAPPPDYQPPVIVTLSPGQSVLIAASLP